MRRSDISGTPGGTAPSGSSRPSTGSSVVTGGRRATSGTSRASCSSTASRPSGTTTRPTTRCATPGTADPARARDRGGVARSGSGLPSGVVGHEPDGADAIDDSRAADADGEGLGREGAVLVDVVGEDRDGEHEARLADLEHLDPGHRDRLEVVADGLGVYPRCAGEHN